MLVTSITHFRPDSELLLPILSSAVPAGFPSPADDYLDGSLDLNEHLVKHPAATFIVAAEGESMIGAGIHSGDLLVVDRAVEPTDGSIVIAVVFGEKTVKRLRREKGKTLLVAENRNYPTLEVTDPDAQIWGVVVWSLHRPR